MTSRLIENILEAEALSEKMRDASFFVVSGEIPSELIEDLRSVEPGKVIILPPIADVDKIVSLAQVKHRDFPYF